MTPILILHGWGSCAEHWRGVAERLQAAGHIVYSPDLPGFGESAALEKPWSIEDYFYWVREYCEKNNLSRFLLVGHSFGGGLAVKIASAYPEKILGLILIAPKIRRQKTFRYYLGVSLAKIGEVVFFIPFLSSLRPFARRALYSLIGTKDYYKLDVEKSLNLKETFKLIVKMDVTLLLPEIKRPTFIIWGDKDRLTPIKDAYMTNKKIENSKLLIVNNGKHGLNLEMPEFLAEKILDFIENGNQNS